MKHDFEYWESAYFEGWLGKLVVCAFVALIVFICIKNFIASCHGS